SGPVAELLSEEEILELSAKDLNTLESAIIKLPEYLSHKINNQTIELKVKGKSDAAKINHFLHQNGVSCSHISMHKHSLEQNFLELLQKSSS
ncbi:MAG TPA: hypothetical protein DCL86_08665, partial [Bacteroidales bacterium]|nr:hypothetical protein [Bacteroidales bacterium]